MRKIIGVTVGTPISTENQGRFYSIRYGSVNKHPSEWTWKSDAEPTYGIWANIAESGKTAWKLCKYNNAIGIWEILRPITKGDIFILEDNADSETLAELYLGEMYKGDIFQYAWRYNGTQLAGAHFIKRLSMGDLDSALDSIIAVQDSLINGFTFTIDYPAANVRNVELRAGVGMTWGEWVNSRYNVVEGYDGKPLYQDGDNLNGVDGDEPVYNSKGERQTLSDFIVSGETYYVKH